MQRIIKLLLALASITTSFSAWADIQVQGYLNSAALENLPADPVSGVIEGRMYWDSVLNLFRIYDGTTWVSVSTTGGVPDPLQLGNGLLAAPTYSFANDTDTGMYLRTVPGEFSLAASGVDTLRCGAVACVTEVATHRFQSGNATDPSIVFEADSLSGLWYDAANDAVNVSLSGAQSLEIDHDLLSHNNASGISQIRALSTGDNAKLILHAQGVGGAHDGLQDSIIEFGDSNDQNRGQILYDHSDDRFLIYAGATVKAIIDFQYDTEFRGLNSATDALSRDPDTVASFRNDAFSSNDAVVNIWSGSLGEASINLGSDVNRSYTRIYRDNNNDTGTLFNPGGGWRIQGATNGSIAPNGYVGETYYSSPGDTASSCNSYANVASIILGPGDYEVWGTCVLNASDNGSGAGVKRMGCGVSLSSTSLDQLDDGGVFFDGNNNTALYGARWMTTNSRAFNLSSSDTIYLNGYVGCTTTPGSWDTNSQIRARRIR